MGKLETVSRYHFLACGKKSPRVFSIYWAMHIHTCKEDKSSYSDIFLAKILELAKID